MTTVFVEHPMASLGSAKKLQIIFEKLQIIFEKLQVLLKIGRHFRKSMVEQQQQKNKVDAVKPI